MPAAILVVRLPVVRRVLSCDAAAEAFRVIGCLGRLVEQFKERQQVIAADLHPYAADCAAACIVVLAALKGVDTAGVHQEDELGDFLVALEVEHRDLGVARLHGGQASRLAADAGSDWSGCATAAWSDVDPHPWREVISRCVIWGTDVGHGVRHDRFKTDRSPAQMKVIAMTTTTTTKTTQPRFPFTRWIDAPLAAVRYLNKELTGAGEAIARSNRV